MDATQQQLAAVNLALQVQSMRNAQKQYFIAIGLAKRSKHQEHRDMAANWLEQSKYQEKLVDASVASILAPQTEEVRS